MHLLISWPNHPYQIIVKRSYFLAITPNRVAIMLRFTKLETIAEP